MPARVCKLTLNRVARVFSVCRYRRGFIRGHSVKIVLRDRKRFENAYTCDILYERKRHIISMCLGNMMSFFVTLFVSVCKRQPIDI